MTEAYLELSETSKMELFAKLVFILDVWLNSECTSEWYIITLISFSFGKLLFTGNCSSSSINMTCTSILEILVKYVVGSQTEM